MFRTVRLSIVRSLFTVHSAMVYVTPVCRQLSSRTKMELQFHPGPARKLFTNLYDIYHCWWINSWWRTEKMSETYRVSCQNKFIKLVHLLQFHLGPARKLSTNLYNIYHCWWINSWWRTEEMSKTYRVSCQNKFVKLVHLLQFHLGPARKLSTNLYNIYHCWWINSWWRTEKMSETYRVSCQNKFVKLVHLLQFHLGPSKAVYKPVWHIPLLVNKLLVMDRGNVRNI